MPRWTSFRVRRSRAKRLSSRCNPRSLRHRRAQRLVPRPRRRSRHPVAVYETNPPDDGMPITVEVVDASVTAEAFDRVYAYFGYVDAGGDVQVMGKNAQGDNWRVGIRNPFNAQQIVKTLALTDCGIATSGTYIRGDHIYNPLND